MSAHSPLSGSSHSSSPPVNWGYLLPICLIATLGGLLFGFDTGVISGAIEPLTAKFGLDGAMKGWVSGCVIIGCAVGVLMVGPLADRFGRKMSMLLAATLFLISSIGTCVPQDIWTFIIFRFIGGLGIGVASITTPMYIAEITPGGQRGRMVAVNQIAIVGGLALVYFVNYGIAKSGPGIAGVPVPSAVLEQALKTEFAPAAMDSKTGIFTLPCGTAQDIKVGMNCSLAVKLDDKAKPVRVALAAVTEVSEQECKATVISDAMDNVNWKLFDPGAPAWPKPVVMIASPADQWNIHSGWRWMFGAGILPAILFALLLLRIPESPRWLIERKRDQQAETILTKVSNAGFAATESAAIRESLAGERGTWSELFSSKLALPLGLGIGLAILQQVTGINVFMYFGTTIFDNMSSKSGVDAGMLAQTVIGGAAVLFTLIAIATVDKLGRKPLMVVGASGMMVCLLVIGGLAQFTEDPTTLGYWPLIPTILYMGFFSLSVGPVVWVILSEIFPTSVRGRALGLATCALWLADYAVTQSFPMMDANPWLLEKFNHAFPFYVYAFFCLVLLGVMVFVPETKGKSLEQIEAMWRRRGDR